MSPHGFSTLTRTAIGAALAALFILPGRAAGPRFYSDDPIAREPESQNAAGARPEDIGLFYDLAYNSFATARRKPSGQHALNVNTIDEVPDSGWFTNRVVAEHALSAEDGRP